MTASDKSGKQKFNYSQNLLILQLFSTIEFQLSLKKVEQGKGMKENTCSRRKLRVEKVITRAFGMREIGASRLFWFYV